MEEFQMMSTSNVEPYVGPRPFQRIDEALFFGREKEASELLSLIIANSVLLIYARSGAGKTSLINARLTPMLEKEEITILPIARVQGRIPQEINLSEIPNANIYVFNALMNWKKKGDNPQSLMNVTLAEFLAREKPPGDDDAEQSRPRVIVFDQFEELFTFYPDRWTDRLEFFRQVSDLLEGSPVILRAGDIKEPASLIKDFGIGDNVLSGMLRTHFSPEVQKFIQKYDGESNTLDVIKLLVDDLNRIIQGDYIFNEEIFAHAELREETRELIRRNPTGRETARLNRLLLEDAYPQIRRQVKGDPFLRVVFSMREDYIAELDPYASVLPNKLRARYRLEPLRERAALSAVKGPLEKTDLHFAPDVAEQLVKNLLEVQMKTAEGITEIPGEFIEPVQLQVVCQSLWDNVRSAGEKEITEEHLLKHGNVAKALRAFYEKSIHNVVQSKGVKEGVLRRWFEDVLITTAGTRGMVFRGTRNTSGLNNEIVDELESQHIIRAELRGGERWYELSHDRFIQPIRESNNDWRLMHSGAVTKRNELEAKAAEWICDNRGKSKLLDESAAIEATRWLDSPEATEVGYSQDLYAFVQNSCLNAAKAQSERERVILEREKMQAESVAQAERERREEQELRAEAERLIIEEKVHRAEAERERAVYEREKAQAEVIAQEQRLRAEEHERHAESERQRAEEQKHLAETERNRAEEKTQLNTRLRKLAVALAMMFILAVGTTFYAMFQRSEALISAKQAIISAVEAQEQAERANQLTKLAQENEALAQESEAKAVKAVQESEAQKKIAEENAQKALQQELLAKAETRRANEQTALARRQEQIAQDAVKEAQRQKEIAENKNAQLAVAQSKLEQAFAEANKKRLEAEQQTDVAKKQTEIANEERAKAEAAKIEAETARKEADIAKAELAKVNESLRISNQAKTVGELIKASSELERNNDYQGALDNYQRVLAIHQQSYDKAGQISALENIGRIQTHLGEHINSQKSYNEALLRIDPIDKVGRARILSTIGSSYINLGDHDEAIMYFQEALAISQGLEDNRGIYTALHGIAKAKMEQGDYKRTEDVLDSALKIAAKLDDPYSLGSINITYAELRVREHKYEQAEDYYKEALTNYKKIKDTRGQVSALNGLINVYRLMKKQDDVNKYTKMLQALQPNPKGRSN
jgi:tetratricopeptide (TPR) repeat protein